MSTFTVAVALRDLVARPTREQLLADLAIDRHVLPGGDALLEVVLPGRVVVDPGATANS